MQIDMETWSASVDGVVRRYNPGMTCPSNHQALRAATSECHVRLDQLFGQFDLSDPSSYGHFLRAHAAVVPALEAALGPAGMSQLLPDWSRRLRSTQLLCDLAELGLDAPTASAPLALKSVGSIWGAAYVLEGSRLGGAVLSKRLFAAAPQRYLGGGQPPSAWPDFLKRLDAGLDSAETLQTAIEAARAVFALFEAAGRNQLETVLSV